jgi:O-antigen/teichoic acid export membrane protein
VRGAGNPQLVRPVVAYLRRAQRRFLLAVLVLGGLALWIAGHRIAPGFHHGWLLLFLAVSIALRAGYMFNIGIAKGLEDFRANAVVALVAAPANLALVVAAMLLDLSVEWLLGIFLLSGAIFYAMSVAQLRPLLPPGEDSAMLPAELMPRIHRQMLYNAAIVTIAFLAASEIEVIFLNASADPHAAGQFKVGHQLATGANTLVPGVFAALLLPMMAGALSEGREVAGRRFAAATAYLAMLALPLAAFGIALAEPLIRLLYGSAYQPAAMVLVVCLSGACLMSATAGASSLLISADRQRAVLAVVLACGVLKVALNASLIPLYGLRGALIAYAAVAVFNAATMMFLAIRESGAEPQWGRIARTALAAAISAAPVIATRALLPAELPSHPIAALSEMIAGGAMMALLYALLTLLFGCWSRNDIEHMQQLHHRLLRSRPRMGARLLSWAHARTGAV